MPTDQSLKYVEIDICGVLAGFRQRYLLAVRW